MSSMNSIFNNPNPYGQYGQGMQYGQQQQRELNWTNALTSDEEKLLHKGPSTLSLDIPKEDMLRAKCTHRDPNTRQFTIKDNADGSVTCLKCGATFNVVDNVQIEEIRRVIGGTIDILNTAKMSYIDMPPEVTQTYFVILPFLEIAPKIYEAAMNILNNAVPGMGMTNNHVSGDYFQMLNNTVGNMGMPQQYQTPPVMQYPGYPQQHMAQVPFMNNPMQTQYMPTQQPQQQMNAQQPGVPQMPQQPQMSAQQPKEGEPVKVSRAFDIN